MLGHSNLSSWPGSWRAASVALLPIFAAVVLIAGCGDDDDGGGGAAPDPKNPTKLTSVMVFTPGGHETDMVAALERGEWKKRGLDVTLQVPGNPGDPQRLVAGGRAEIGTSHSSGVLVARAQGAPLIGIAARHQQGTNGTLVLKDSGIKAPKDLEGKTISVTGVPENRVMFEKFMAENGVDKDEVKVIEGGFEGQSLLASGRVDGNGDAIAWFEYLLVNQQQGKPLRDKDRFNFFQFTENGVPEYYEYVMFTREDYAKENPEVLRAFLAGWEAGMKWARENPDEAVDLVLEKYPEARELEAFHRAEWKEIVPITESPSTDEHCFGWMESDVWEGFADFLTDEGVLDQPVEGKEAFTNEYLPCA